MERGREFIAKILREEESEKNIDRVTLRVFYWKNVCHLRLRIVDFHDQTNFC